MVADNITNDTIMIDLSEIPTELLRQELDKREQEERRLRKKLAHDKVCCKNCAYRIYGKTQFNSSLYDETWVCQKRPKTPQNVFGRTPDYNKAYFVCLYKYNGCNMFLHKDSEEGQKIAKKNQAMSFRVID